MQIHAQLFRGSRSGLRGIGTLDTARRRLWPLPIRISDVGFRISAIRLVGLGLVAIASSALAQPRPYIGFVYPAGGQQGTTFQIRLGGQQIDDVSSVLVTGSGITTRIADNYRRLNFQELQVLYEQTRVLRREMLSTTAKAEVMMDEKEDMLSDLATNKPAMLTASTDTGAADFQAQSSNKEEASAASKKVAARKLLEKIERRTGEYVANPASASLASIIMVEVTIGPDAEPGEREIRIVTLRGVSNPMAFYVGQVPEHSRKPLVTASKQILGKESEALRKHSPDETVEDRITLPCSVNGQIASGEVNRYRFEARQGQRLVITTLGRQLVPFIADAVPGWFQPVLAVYDASGKEVAYDDDYRFKPDPTILYEVPKDGEYVFAIHDSLYRGREDFVYRITAGELPFITSLFPLGAQTPPAASSAPSAADHGGDGVRAPLPEIKGWNLEGAELLALPADVGPGIHQIAVRAKSLVSNRVPFARGPFPEVLEQEPNNTMASAQKVTLPVIVNGRINKPDDWDVFEFTGQSNEMVVAEVQARRLDSPLDSVIKLTDAAGNLLAVNDDHEDLASGLNTHQADSYFLARLPADGQYFVHIGDTARQGGEEYGYRLRLSAPQPDFDLRVVPSSLGLRSKSSGALTVYVQRKEGFAGPIKLSLKDAPAGFSAGPVTLSATQSVGKLNVKTDLVATPEPVNLSIVGTAKVGDQELAHLAVPAEDRMQAFLWRHLVPARDLKVLVFDPSYRPPPKRIAHLRPTPVVLPKPVLPTNTVSSTNSAAGTNALAAAEKAKFTRQQVAARLKELKLLFEEGMLTEEFYQDKVAECETEQME